jgi:hypothetical protein
MSTEKGMIEVQEQLDLFDNTYTSGVSIDRETLTACIKAALNNLTLEQLVASLTNEFAEILEYVALASGARRASQKLTLLFNPHRLDTRTQTSKMSFFEALSAYDAFPSGLARATLMRQKEGTPPGQMLNMVMQLGVNGIQICNDFPPHVARDWCQRYRLDPDARVLDPCAGWGGRLAGCSVRVDHYVGYEPATRTAEGLKKLAEFVNRARGGVFTAEVFCEPYEDSQERPNFYDLAMTSPPYYDSEVYSEEETNSLNRYKSFDSWCQGFYWPLIDKTMRQLKPGAPFIFNIGDRRWPLTDKLIQHCERQGYTWRKLTGDIVDSGGIGRDMQLDNESREKFKGKSLSPGEKFFELRRVQSSTL